MDCTVQTSCAEIWAQLGGLFVGAALAPPGFDKNGLEECMKRQKAISAATILSEGGGGHPDRPSPTARSRGGGHRAAGCGVRAHTLPRWWWMLSGLAP